MAELELEAKANKATPPAPAHPADQPILENEDQNSLKHLDFVRLATLYVVVFISSIYQFAKQNSGPLRPCIQTVEGSVIRPVYDKFHALPFHLLKFIDRKVDDFVIKLDHRIPEILKVISRNARIVGQKAPGVAREIASEVRRTGFSNTAQHVYVKYEPAAKELYRKYEPVGEHYAVSAWRSLNRLPLFPQMAHIAVPTAKYWAGKYNQAVGYATGKGYTVSHYLPLIPIDRIAKVFGSRGNAPLPNGPHVETLAKTFENQNVSH